MATQSHTEDVAAVRERMPAGLRWAILGGVALLLTGALLLIAVRGQALLVDLQGLSQRIFCF
jgi:hypothetical protein